MDVDQRVIESDSGIETDSSVDQAVVAELLSALFADEFADGIVDYDVVEQIHRGEVGEWVTAVAQSGLFAEMTVCALGERWRREPKRLLELMLTHLDDLTVKRVSVTWAVLDRSAPLAHIS